MYVEATMLESTIMLLKKKMDQKKETKDQHPPSSTQHGSHQTNSEL